MVPDGSSVDSWAPVFEARNYAEAGMVRGILEGEGLAVRLDSVLGIPHLGFSGRVTVSVPASAAQRGREIVAAYFGAPADLGAPEPAEAPAAKPDHRGEGQNMKLLMLVVHNDDAHAVMNAMIKAGHRVTRLASTGGMLGEGNTTVFCGLPEDRLDETIALVSEVCRPRDVDLQRGHPLFSEIRSVRMGGAVGFIVDIERFFRLA